MKHAVTLRLVSARLIICRCAALLACACAPLDAKAADAPPSAPDSKWVFDLLPKSLQKNPRLDVTILSELTEAGRKLSAVDPAHPAYYVLQSGGYHARNGDTVGEAKVAREEIDAFVRKSLAQAGYLSVDSAPGKRPSLVLTYIWGVHGEPLASETMSPGELDRNLRERATLVGGEKFAKKLLELVRRNSELMDAQTSGLRLDVGTDRPAPPPVGAELFAFMNPIERFRAESPKNATLLEQVRGDMYYVVVSAYDHDQLAQGQRVLLWRTRMTAGADGVAQTQAVPTLVRTAAAYFGRDMPEPATISPRTSGEGRTSFGPLEVIEADVRRPTEKK